MEDSEIRRMYEWIQKRVNLAMDGDGIVISFDEPGSGDFTEAGFATEAVELTLHSDWWSEMVTDIVEKNKGHLTISCSYLSQDK